MTNDQPPRKPSSVPHRFLERHGLGIPYVLLAIPFFATLAPWLYDRVRPSLFGFPFFYWYLMAWLLVTPLLMGVIVYLTRGRDDVE